MVRSNQLLDAESMTDDEAEDLFDLLDQRLPRTPEQRRRLQSISAR